VRVSAVVRLPQPPDVAWARLIDWDRQPEWMADAAAVRVLTERREGAGVRIAVRTRVLGVPLLTDVLEVAEWDPPRRLAMARRGFVRGRGEWRLEPSDGSTLFSWHEEIRVPVPLLGELVLSVYRPFLQRLMRRSMGRLAETLR
jgi:hypothetical protein